MKNDCKAESTKKRRLIFAAAAGAILISGTGFFSPKARAAEPENVREAAAKTLSRTGGEKNPGTAESSAEEKMYGIGSTSKMVVTAAVLKLAEEGKLDLDRPLTEYIPEFSMADERCREITPRMLLNHSSGLQGSSLKNSMLLGDSDTCNHDMILTWLRSQRLKANPGELAAYCNDGFTLAEILVERVGGLSYTDYIETYFAGPLGLRHMKTPQSGVQEELLARVYDEVSGLSLPPENPNVIGSGGVYASAGDLCRFSQIFMKNPGTAEGILSPESVKESLSSPYWESLGAEGEDTTLSYGLGWDCVNAFPFSRLGIRALTKGGDTSFYHSGLTVLPEQNISCAVLSSGGSSTLNQLAAQEIILAYLEETGRIDGDSLAKELAEREKGSKPAENRLEKPENQTEETKNQPEEAKNQPEETEIQQKGTGNQQKEIEIQQKEMGNQQKEAGNQVAQGRQVEEKSGGLSGSQEQYSGWYAGRGMLRATAGEGGELTLKSTDGRRETTQTYQYGGDGRFYAQKGSYISLSGELSRGSNGRIGRTFLEFKADSEGRQYLMGGTREVFPGLGETAVYLPVGQKISPGRPTDGARRAWEGRSGKAYYLVSDKYSSAAYLTNFMATPRTLPEPEGYLVFEDSIWPAAEILDETHARFFQQIPGQMGRDLNDYKIVGKDGTEYLDTGNMRLICEDGVKALDSNTTSVKIGGDGETVWYSVDESFPEKDVTITCPENGAFYIYDRSLKDMRCILSSYVTEPGQKLRLPKEGCVAFAGAAGAEFIIRP